MKSVLAAALLSITATAAAANEMPPLSSVIKNMTERDAAELLTIRCSAASSYGLNMLQDSYAATGNSQDLQMATHFLNQFEYWMIAALDVHETHSPKYSQDQVFDLVSRKSMNAFNAYLQDASTSQANTGSRLDGVLGDDMTLCSEVYKRNLGA